MDQQFCLLTHRICPSKIMSTETALDEKGRWTWSNIPAVIQIKTRLGQNEQVHLTYCTFEKNNQGQFSSKFQISDALPVYYSINIFSGTWTIKALKQRIRIGRFAFCLQEIYGIEQKAEGEEPESECAICWDEERVFKKYRIHVPY